MQVLGEVSSWVGSHIQHLTTPNNKIEQSSVIDW
jgi:hypothetical protein